MQIIRKYYEPRLANRFRRYKKKKNKFKHNNKTTWLSDKIPVYNFLLKNVIRADVYVRTNIYIYIETDVLTYYYGPRVSQFHDE